ncbi:hypothetical protein [Thermoplasma volcanium GSS1]|uniref:Dihydroneopterin aldolase n=1 Tax=Thermoplasma volcanium (strain ATCC 51530 / DSM 4299 / JCM 9571 / NBRC 15438 / GSS1) TaxID=273116 RepID=Q97AR0_THEVO|nr:dihydroneopterin aldolase family protein [Thermoplasma volcanium]BAB59891.1 hypothetical protein [Thermoplasma volcanium GSS1]
MKDPAAHYFKCTSRERAIFEAGIKLGTVYHQYVGIPLNQSNISSLEKAIRDSIMVQPFVVEAEVKIDPNVNNKKPGVYKYLTLSGEMLDVMVKVDYEGSVVKARLRYVPEMDYPLMYIEE